MKMKQKIACSAERLILLDPQMIESVADAKAFRVGRQYMTENRVRIVEAEDTRISSAVIGNSGLYEQTITLRDGHLISKCSCPLPEEPMCRHSIAVLLEYHRWAQPRRSQKAKAAQAAAESQVTDPPGKESPAPRPTSVPDVKLSEIMSFVEWLEPAMRAIEEGTEIPQPPQLSPGGVSMWITSIRNLEERRRTTQDVLLNLESERRDREAYLGRLSQQLQSSIGEAKAAQAAMQTLQREVAEYKEIVAKVAELADKVMGHEGQILTAAGELLGKAANLERLASSSHELVDSLKSAIKPSPTN